MNRSETLRARYRAETVGRFDGLIAPYVRSGKRVLDAGCGEGDPVLESLSAATPLIGADVDWAGLRKNSQARHRVYAGLENLPIASASMETIVCKYVAEHLADPARAFREFHRVLKPGGVVAVLTPNRYSLFGATTLLLPESVRLPIKRFLRGKPDDGIFPAHYRANTPKRLGALFGNAGFECLHFDTQPALWGLFCRYPALALTMRVAERTQSRAAFLRPYGCQLIGLWRKHHEQ